MNNYTDIKEKAAYRWDAILSALGIFSQALNGKHQACQGCGGKDRFRYVGGSDGKWFCSGGGFTTGGDGFELLCHVFGQSKSEALHAVAEYLGVGKKSVKHHQKVDPDVERLKRLNREVKQKREVEKKRKYAQKIAKNLWNSGVSVIKHAYLTKKQIEPVNIRQYCQRRPTNAHRWRTCDSVQIDVLISRLFDGKRCAA